MQIENVRGEIGGGLMGRLWVWPGDDYSFIVSFLINAGSTKYKQLVDVFATQREEHRIMAQRNY